MGLFDFLFKRTGRESATTNEESISIKKIEESVLTSNAVSSCKEKTWEPALTNNAVTKDELGNAIRTLSNCLADLVQCETMRTFHAPMGSFNQQLSLMLQTGNVLTEYYETVYRYGSVSSLGVKGFKSGKYSDESKRNVMLKTISDGLSDISLMLINIKMTGFAQDSAMANGYVHFIAEIEDIIERLK